VRPLFGIRCTILFDLNAEVDTCWQYQEKSDHGAAARRPLLGEGPEIASAAM
jgi:hypothetical protein